MRLRIGRTELAGRSEKPNRDRLPAVGREEKRRGEVSSSTSIRRYAHGLITRKGLCENTKIRYRRRMLGTNDVEILLWRIVKYILIKNPKLLVYGVEATLRSLLFISILRYFIFLYLRRRGV